MAQHQLPTARQLHASCQRKDYHLQSPCLPDQQEHHLPLRSLVIQKQTTHNMAVHPQPVCAMTSHLHITLKELPANTGCLPTHLPLVWYTKLSRLLHPFLLHPHLLLLQDQDPDDLDLDQAPNLGRELAFLHVLPHRLSQTRLILVPRQERGHALGGKRIKRRREGDIGLGVGVKKDMCQYLSILILTTPRPPEYPL